MSDAKPLASLGASLLARKGSAKPAMRPQSARAAVSNQAAAQNLEDLGWDDMGDEDNAANHTAEVLSLTPSPHNKEAEALTDKASPKPKVRSMHEELALRLAEEEAKANPAAKKQALPRVTPVKKQALPPIDLDDEADEIELEAHAPSNVQPIAVMAGNRTEAPKAKPMAANDSRRAAFTLRLDAKRHLKLRLAATVRGRSAQQLVTEALDRFLDQIPEIEALAAHVKRD
jgi:hypothetical protein